MATHRPNIGSYAMNNEVWVLGATGRTGRLIARRLHERGVSLVLIGRDRERLDHVVAEFGGAPRLIVGSLESALAKLAEDAPGVVVNTVGPFTTTATEVAGACPPGTHYVDVANELAAVEHDPGARPAGCCREPGARHWRGLRRPRDRERGATPVPRSAAPDTGAGRCPGVPGHRTWRHRLRLGCNHRGDSVFRWAAGAARTPGALPICRGTDAVDYARR